MRQKLTKKLPKIVSAFSNNAITSKVFRKFLWNKKQWKADKVALKLIYTFTYFMYLLSPNLALIFLSLKFGHFGRFLVFPFVPLAFLPNVARLDCFMVFFKELEPICILLYTLQINVFLNLPEDSKYCRNLVIFHNYFS